MLMIAHVVEDSKTLIFGNREELLVWDQTTGTETLCYRSLQGGERVGNVNC